MPLINLIQEQRLEARSRQRKIQGAMVGTLGVGALCLVATAALLLDATRLNIQANALEQKKKELEPLIKELNEKEAKLERLTPRLETLETATVDSAKWERVLQHLSVNTPAQTWLTSVKAFQPDPNKPLVLTFNGISTTQEAVGELQLRLEQANDLENAQLRFTQPKFSETGRQFEFEISSEMVGTKAEEETASEVKKP